MIRFGVTSLGTMSTVAGIPIAIVMDVGVVTAGSSSIANSRIGKYLGTKMEKHEKIRMIAEAKLNTISSYISN